MKEEVEEEVAEDEVEKVEERILEKSGVDIWCIKLLASPESKIIHIR